MLKSNPAILEKISQRCADQGYISIYIVCVCVCVYGIYFFHLSSIHPSLLPLAWDWNFLLRLLDLVLLLGHLLLTGNGGLDADAAKDETDAEPLHARKAVAKGHDGEDHGEHLAGDGYRDEQDG